MLEQVFGSRSASNKNPHPERTRIKIYKLDPNRIRINLQMTSQNV